MTRLERRRRRESGQVLVLVAGGMVALILIVGLVLDGGSAFGQRRGQQRGADLAALAGANDLLLNNDASSAEAVALQVATDNGFDPAQLNVTAHAILYGQGHAGSVKVDITEPHANSFSALVGMNSWDVSVSATAVTGSITGSRGSGPFMFSVKNFLENGMPDPAYTLEGCGAGGCAFGTRNGDAPVTNLDGTQDLAWTNFGTGNVDTNQVSDIISGELVLSNDIDLNDYIGQYNSGFHNALFSDVEQYLKGKDVLVPIVTEQVDGISDGPESCGGGLAAGGGCFQGWAVFHVVDAVGGSDKHIYGYFVSQTFAPGGTVDDCGGPCETRSFGNYTLYLSE
jgi:Flp pilus assembly protein TadG